MATRLAIASAVVLAAAASTQAAFVETVSFTAGAPNVDTTKAHWNTFFDTTPLDVPITDNTPDVAFYNPNGTANLSETTGTAIVTGSGNIYSPTTLTSFVTTIPVRDAATAENVTAVVQIRTQGADIDLSTLRLAGTAPVSSAFLGSFASGSPFGGSVFDNWYLFNVPNSVYSNDDNAPDTLTLTFSAAATSLSLDQLRIDTVSRPGAFLNEPTPTPEPAALGLLALGGIALLRRKR